MSLWSESGFIFFDWRQFSAWNQPLKLSVRHKNTKCSSFPKNGHFQQNYSLLSNTWFCQNILTHVQIFGQTCVQITEGTAHRYWVHKFKLHPCFFTIFLKFHWSRAVIIAEGTGSEVNPRVDLRLALVVLALPRVCLLPSCQVTFSDQKSVANTTKDLGIRPNTFSMELTLRKSIVWT